MPKLPKPRPKESFRAVIGRPSNPLEAQSLDKWRAKAEQTGYFDKMRPAHNPSLISSAAADTMLLLAEKHGISQEPHRVMSELALRAKNSGNFGEFLKKATDLLDSKGIESSKLEYSLLFFLDGKNKRYRPPGTGSDLKLTPEALKKKVDKNFLPNTRSLVRKNAAGSSVSEPEDFRTIEEWAKFYHFANNEAGPLKAAIDYLSPPPKLPAAEKKG